MDIKFASKGILCTLGFITLGAMSVSAFAQSTEYRRGYDQGYRDGFEAQSRQDQQGQQGGPRRGIYIVEAQYGLRDESCDAQDKVQHTVGWRRIASITANNQLCGDPVPGRSKRLRITYHCGDGEELNVRAPEGKTVTLNCR